MTRATPVCHTLCDKAKSKRSCKIPPISERHLTLTLFMAPKDSKLQVSFLPQKNLGNCIHGNFWCLMVKNSAWTPLNITLLISSSTCILSKTTDGRRIIYKEQGMFYSKIGLSQILHMKSNEMVVLEAL